MYDKEYIIYQDAMGGYFAVMNGKEGWSHSIAKAKAFPTIKKAMKVVNRLKVSGLLQVLEIEK